MSCAALWFSLLYSGIEFQHPACQYGHGGGAGGHQGEGQQSKGRAGEQAGYTCTATKIHLTASPLHIWRRAKRTRWCLPHLSTKDTGNWTPVCTLLLP